MNKTINLNFEIKAASFAVAAYLQELSLEDIIEDARKKGMYLWFETYPFYNCRERSIALCLCGINMVKHVWVFGEVRNTDQIFVDYFTTRSCDNPTLKDFTEKAYKERKTFDCSKANDVSYYIKEQIQERVDISIKEKQEEKPLRELIIEYLKSSKSEKNANTIFNEMKISNKYPFFQVRRELNKMWEDKILKESCGEDNKLYYSLIKK